MYENLTRLDLVGPALARALGDPGWERLEASLVSGGKSNLTFELTSDAGEAVLRRPPDGPLLPRAHDMAREARVQRALAGTVVPVAAMNTCTSSALNPPRLTRTKCGVRASAPSALDSGCRRDSSVAR